MKIIDQQTETDENQVQKQEVQSQQPLSTPLTNHSDQLCKPRHFLILTNFDILNKGLLIEHTNITKIPSSIDKNIHKIQNGGKNRNFKNSSQTKKNKMLKEVIAQQLDLLFQI